MVECFGYFLKVIRMTSVKVGTNIVVPSNFLHCFQLYNLYMMNEKCHISNVYKVFNIINPATSPRKSSLNLKSFFPHFFPRGSFWISSHIFIKACVATESGGQASPDQCLLRSLDFFTGGFLKVQQIKKKSP